MPGQVVGVKFVGYTQSKRRYPAFADGGGGGGVGPQGPAGTNGTNGTNGAQGIQGIQGIQGVQGNPGTNGTDGTDGTNGTNGQGFVNFSTLEVGTGILWINGQQIFRKVIEFANGPNVVQLSIGHGVAPVVVTRLYGMMLNAGGDQYPIPWVGENQAADVDFLSLKADATNVYLTPSGLQVGTGAVGDWSMFNGFIVMEYTKA